MSTKTSIAPGMWTYKEYAAIPNDGKRHEIIEGEHYVSPAPNLYHQEISRRLQFQLYMAIEIPELGVVIDAPVDVQLSEKNIVQPDLVIIRKRNRRIMTPIQVKGIPDLLIEILSPSNSEHDLVKKRRMYERNRVPEYWIVFPDEQQILQLTLVGEKYEEAIFTEEITFDVPPLMTVDLRKVW